MSTVERLARSCLFFFFNDTATTEIYTLSLHDALPICARLRGTVVLHWRRWPARRASAPDSQTEARFHHRGGGQATRSPATDTKPRGPAARATQQRLGSHTGLGRPRRPVRLRDQTRPPML